MKPLQWVVMTSVMPKRMLNATAAADDDLRAEAHASCALQLEPALQGSPLYEPWMRRVSWVYLEASEVDGLGSDFTRLDKVGQL